MYYSFFEEQKTIVKVTVFNNSKKLWCLFCLKKQEYWNWSCYQQCISRLEWLAHIYHKATDNARLKMVTRDIEHGILDQLFDGWNENNPEIYVRIIKMVTADADLDVSS